jgi:predicted lactoylglutathione lyase
MLFDHVDLRVSDLTKVRGLYDALMRAMGYSLIAEDRTEICYLHPDGSRSKPFFALSLDPHHRPNGTRIALRASDEAEVDRLAAIAKNNGASAFEPAHVCVEYTPFYYAAFFEDRDGNKLEICFRKSP